jgi:lipoprotein LprG
VRPALRRPVGVVAVVTLAVLAGGCGARAASGTRNPAQLLAAARRVIDAARSVHFELQSSGVASSGTQLVSGSGSLVRPDELSGTFTVTQSGVPVAVQVVAVGSAFYVQLPLAHGYTRVSPNELGFGDPAALINPTTGVASLLVEMAPAARTVGQRRIGGELVDVVSGSVPGDKVSVLPDADPARPIRLTVSVDPSTDQVRQVVLVGPFTSATATTTYTVTLTRYGEHVTVKAPTG